MLAKTAPVIMQVKREDKDSPIGQFISDSPTPARTATIIRHSLFARDLKNLMQSASSAPKAAPTTRDKAISRRGVTTVLIKVNCSPTAKTFANATHIENTISPIASSNATTGRSVSVTMPRALYCFTTMSVAAGAVAVAIAPSRRIMGVSIWSGKANFSANSPSMTNATANNAWQKVIVTMLFPSFFKCSSLNSPPMENAIKPSATVLIIFM